MAQQPDATNVQNSEQQLQPHQGRLEVTVPKHDDIELKVNPGGAGAQQLASDGFRGN